ncbi:phosphomannomutase [Porticoccus sp. W117]|uniref:phosphomannomutase n=1 Tax=Porticoccus sp. W117 TaxID=3054777 RepID=UPI0025963DEE|nr:phosphomannomutase [Porticoccus sp. W117]MDM3872402.1 phosphomannomutase [Porticoccus sp. W117]
MSEVMEQQAINCFKAYDVRGRVPDELNTDVAYRIGRATAQFLDAKRMVVGHDIRLTSPELCNALIQGLREGGVNVTHIGQCGTEEIYFATSYGNFDGGIVVTASHNPMDYNGMKFVREQSKPISGDNGLLDIKALAEQNQFADTDVLGTLAHDQDKTAYIEHLRGYVDHSQLKPLKLVVNAGNGGAGSVVDLLEPHLPFEFIKVHHQPDGNFPNGVPNPLLEENRAATADQVRQQGADLGIAWDGDFDRCFFFDENGDFVEGYYLVGLLAESFLNKHGSGSIVHDPRLTWNTIDVANRLGGTPVLTKTGHAFIKQCMRDHDAIYGGEMSAHHYFRDFAYCDSGMIPWLLVAEIVSQSGKTLSQLVAECQKAYPCSGEINSRIQNTEAVLAELTERYGSQAKAEDRTDGLSLDMGEWRFNVRMSNTEPVVRLNVESRGNPELMREKTAELLAVIRK